MELQNTHVDGQQAYAEAQRVWRHILQMVAAFGKDKIKAIDPSHFVESHEEMEGWMVACRLKIANRPSKVVTKGKKVIYAASFLDGPSCSWMQLWITAYFLDLENLSTWKLASFDALVEVIRVLFEDPTLERNAIVALTNIY